MDRANSVGHIFFIQPISLPMVILTDKYEQNHCEENINYEITLLNTNYINVCIISLFNGEYQKYFYVKRNTLFQK